MCRDSGVARRRRPAQSRQTPLKPACWRRDVLRTSDGSRGDTREWLELPLSCAEHRGSRPLALRIRSFASSSLRRQYAFEEVGDHFDVSFGSTGPIRRAFHTSGSPVASLLLAAGPRRPGHFVRLVGAPSVGVDGDHFFESLSWSFPTCAAPFLRTLRLLSAACRRPLQRRRLPSTRRRRPLHAKKIACRTSRSDAAWFHCRTSFSINRLRRSSVSSSGSPD